ncbi:multidrug transporter [Klebsiella pneumoniae]|uniref:Multidrug transporter n=1 Tax=Klebsiella pneumoniae TaxID=573 RepID=A0A2X3CIK5_KLEPN|nr:multidrug transporter [Klebsiella pneumoniae]
MSLLPPAISDMGTSSGFTYYLQDRGGKGYQALKKAADELIVQANHNPHLADVYIDGLGEGTSLSLHVDREKAEAMGVSFDEINQTISVAAGSNYVNDYTNNGRVQQVIVQADAPYRMQPEQLLALSVKNRLGQMLPLSTFVTLSWNVAPQQLIRYQGYPAIRITGSSAQGKSSGTAMAAMDNLAKHLPPGFAGEWGGKFVTGKRVCITASGSYCALGTGWYSWCWLLFTKAGPFPFAVMLVVPLGLLGAVLAVSVTNMTNDVFFKVGLITLIGLSAKNAILIIEFARQLMKEGKSLIDATLTAAKLRLRPILMTSLAFTLGVVPLMLASGASDSTQHAIGTGVFGGMISGTLLAIFFVPVFFVTITRFTGMRKYRLGNSRNG